MKTAEFLNDHKNALKAVRRNSNKTMLTRMVVQNIADLIPAELKATYSGYGVKYTPVEGATVTPDVFDKLVAKLAKQLHQEPRKSVYPSTISANFWVYPVAYSRHDWGEGVNIEITIGNTEKCDFVVRRKMQQVSEPTGYCKALLEKKYLAAK
jgi:hypothetical protein